MADRRPSDGSPSPHIIAPGDSSSPHDSPSRPLIVPGDASPAVHHPTVHEPTPSVEDPMAEPHDAPQTPPSVSAAPPLAPLALVEPLGPVLLTTLQQVVLSAEEPVDYTIESGTCTLTIQDNRQAVVVAAETVGESMVLVTTKAGTPPLTARVRIQVALPVLALTINTPVVK